MQTQVAPKLASPEIGALAAVFGMIQADPANAPYYVGAFAAFALILAARTWNLRDGEEPKEASQ